MFSSRNDYKDLKRFIKAQPRYCLGFPTNWPAPSHALLPASSASVLLHLPRDAEREGVPTSNSHRDSQRFQDVLYMLRVLVVRGCFVEFFSRFLAQINLKSQQRVQIYDVK